MGSTNHGDIPVVNKYTTTNLSFIKHSRRIKQNASATDEQTTLQVDATTRAIGSGSLIQDGVVTHHEELVVGITMPGRTVNARIASGADAERSLSVDLADNKTQEVIETSLQPHTPQEGVKHAGGKVIVSNTADGTASRIDN